MSFEQGTADLAPRIQTLDEQLGLAQSQRFAPRSEKLTDRVFNEAEQMAQAYDDADDAFALPDTGLPQVNEPEGGKRGRKPLPANLPPQRIEYDVPEDQKICACCGHGMHRMGEDNSEQLHIDVKASVLQQVWFQVRMPALRAPRRPHAGPDCVDACRRCRAAMPARR
ncbi:hypothetical protein HDG41_006479 [Paraburkholderia sp. JPY162]|uniref:Transposase TnpC homeodomain domain-containing protein n=1 Tax=Paraburkholderia youngii TaxID=2782701 RepID=A0A7W8P7B8_9BURK|nr:hypothetical protein [Paraburkholderia youngii]